MTNTGFSKLGLRLLDRVTDRIHSFGPKVFQRAFVGTFGNRTISEWYLRKYRQEWNAAVSEFLEVPTHRAKILVIVDVCIGDAVVVSEMLPILRDAFPQTEVHYVCNRTGGMLIEGMPEIQVHPIVQGKRGFPTRDDKEQVRSLIEKEEFSLVLNFGPFFQKRSLEGFGRVIQLYVPFAAYTLRAWKEKGMRHISYLSRNFISELASGSEMHSERLASNSIYLSMRSIREAQAFLESRRLSHTQGILFWNPDATSQYGQIPFEVQTRILNDVAKRKEIRAILIGKAYSNSGVEERIVESIPERFRSKLYIVPHLPIETYTALIDTSDMFVSGDTGPLHVAACRKFSNDGRPLRNRTAVTAIYGATDSRMYGYDSFQPHHAPAHQDVPSRSFSAPAPCRNISCINKFGKSCRKVRCFDGLPMDEIVSYISNYFIRLSNGDDLLPAHPLHEIECDQKPIQITLTEGEFAF